MTGAVTWEVLAIIAAVVGGAFIIWWRIEGRVERARTDAMMKSDEALAKSERTAVQLAEYKTHVAETYISKAGHRESTDQILNAISRIDGRLDRVLDSRTARRSTKPE